MGLNLLFLDFIERIAVGAGAVLVVLLVICFGLPRRRSAIAVSRRSIR